MPTPFNMVDPARQMTTLINQEGEAVPIEMIVREGVFNGLDSNQRYKFNNSEYSEKNRIIISKDFEFENKLRITNVGGDYFSEEVALENFLTLANTSVENKNVNNDYDDTKGRGAKISYLPHAPEGILYRSKNEDGEGVMFHVKFHKEGFYGLSDFEDPDIGLTCFPFCDDFNHELTDSHGTDMVLMGGGPEQDTWNQLNVACGMGNTKNYSVSGWNFVNYISNRFWGPPPSDIYVQIYDSKRGSENFYKPKNLHKCTDLKTQFEMRKTNGSFELPESPGVIKGTKVYFCHLDSGQRGHYWTTRSGFVGFAYKGEIYYDKNKDSNSHRADLKNCGIYTKSREWLIIFEIPQEEKLYSSGDRTFLKNVDKNSYFDCLKENLPDEIKSFLDSNTNSDIDGSDLRQWLRKELSCFRMPQGINKKTDNVEELYPNAPSDNVGNDSNAETKPKTSSNSSSKRQKMKSANNRLKCADVPNIVHIEDPEAEFLRFDFEEYTLYLNSEHDVFRFRVNKFLDQFHKLKPEEIDKIVKEYSLKSALYRVFEVQQVYGDQSIQQKKLKWAPEILEALWSVDTDGRIKNTLTRKQAHRSAA